MQKCIVKTGQNNRPCGQGVEYLTAAQAQARGSQYSGWRHAGPGARDHGAVPASHIGRPTSKVQP